VVQHGDLLESQRRRVLRQVRSELQLDSACRRYSALQQRTGAGGFEVAGAVVAGQAAVEGQVAVEGVADAARRRQALTCLSVSMDQYV